MNMNGLLSAVQNMQDHAEGLTAPTDRAQLKVSVGAVQFEAAGGPDESVADLREEFVTVFAHLHEQAEEADTDAPDTSDVQDQIRNVIEQRERNAVEQISRGCTNMNQETYTATTDESGEATFEDLPPGEYEVVDVEGHDLDSVEVEWL